MTAWKKFIEELNITQKLEEIYFNIRLVLQREGWSDKDLEKPPYYPQDLMGLFHKFQNERDKIIKTIEDYGFEIDINDLTDYIQIKLKSIDKITPLNN